MTQRRPLVTAAVLAALVGPATLLAQPSGATNLPSDSASGPTNLRYKGVSITPIGFFAAEAFYRQRTLQADMPSSYNALPFTHTAQGQISEFRGSARQSRLGVLGEGRLSQVAVSGYFEGDFLSSGTSSNSNESNSYPFRVRQFWAQAAFKNGFTFTGGQMWSLLSPARAGIATRAEYIPSVIEAQYVPGFDWARQFGARVTYRANRNVAVAASLEEPQTTFTARGAVNPTVAVLNSQPGGGALNATANYSYDVAPDAIVKIAFDQPGVAHFELKALGRIFRDRIYTVIPGTTTTTTTGTTTTTTTTPATNGGATNYTTAAGGVGASLFLPIQKTVDIGLNALYGRGIGRYGSSQIADATLNERGEVVPIRAAHGLATVDLHATPALDIYGYGGVEYAYRTAGVNSAGKGVGYGSPLLNNTGCETELLPTATNGPATGTCNADTRAVAQGAAGFWYRFYRGNRGTVQFGVQYSHTERSTWSSNATAAAAAGGPRVQPLATDNMVFTSFRYYLP
ncbi:hypothetical protein tb265_42400 [Gemmatimonadetes bacterium T265]|nr:hypothetical protein tb265_42400 [Gemmatimonadetes bacterium T265]